MFIIRIFSLKKCKLLTISNDILSLVTGSKSGTVKDSGKESPRASASAAFIVVEKQWSQDQSLLPHKGEYDEVPEEGDNEPEEEPG